MIDSFSIDQSVTHVRGWFIVPFNPPEVSRFRANGNLLVAPQSYLFDPELQKLLIPSLPNSAYRFTLVYPAPSDIDFHSIEFLPSGLVDCGDVALRGWYLLDPSREDDPVPEGENINRVISNGRADLYRLGGATVANRINAYLQQAKGKSLSNIGTVLDWGCGCARVSRYIRKLGCSTLHGVDVDPTNFQWCKSHLDWFEVQLSQLSPPLPFPDRHFDLIVGISIFTHLREPSQVEWLKELARVLKPGGTCLVTVMREGQVALQIGGANMVSQVVNEGFVMIDDNEQLKLGDDADNNYYVNVYHSAHYIFENWRKYFKIIDILPFVGAHQDVVVLEGL